MNTNNTTKKKSPFIIISIVVAALLGGGFMGKLMFDMVSYMKMMTIAVVSMSKNVNVTLGAAANYKTREQVTKTVSTGTLSVPEIEYTNIQFLAGLVWYL